MRIALVVHDFDPRFGHGRYTVELARRLGSQHEVHVFANTFHMTDEPNLTLHRVPAIRRRAILSILSFIIPAERLVRRARFDLIHAQGLTCWSADIITGHMCNAARRAHAPSAHWRGSLFHALVDPLERAFYRRRGARHLIAISNRFGDEIRAYYSWHRPVSVIYHGTDTEQFRPAATEEECQAVRRRFGLPPNAWVWLFMGEAVKGLREAIQQLAQFPEATLFVISRSMPEPYRRFAQTVGVNGRLHFWGPDPCPAACLRAADAFVYPTPYDSFGLVITEAMATGLPVVVGREAGAAELIEHGRNGLLCDPQDTSSLRNQLERLRADPAAARALGAKARATVQKHSWDACAAATEAVYEQVLAAKRRDT